MLVIKLTKGIFKIEPALITCLFHININRLLSKTKDLAANNFGFGEIGEISEYFKKLNQNMIRSLFKNN